MGKQVRRIIRTLIIGALLAGLLAGPVCAETDGFISNAGIFDWLSAPHVSPKWNAQPSEGWIGTFYAPGVGLEMSIWDMEEGEGILHCAFVNYANPDEAEWNRMHESLYPVDGGFVSQGEGFILRDLHDGRFTMDINDSWAQWLDSRGTPLYGRPATIEFTDVTRLMANPVENRFGGAYFYDDMELSNGVEVYSDNTYFLSFLQLYGTSDYYMVSQRTFQGREQTDSCTSVFLIDSDGALIHNYGYSVVTETDYIERYELRDEGPQKRVAVYAGDDGIVVEYNWCSNKTMWGD